MRTILAELGHVSPIDINMSQSRLCLCIIRIIKQWKVRIIRVNRVQPVYWKVHQDYVY